MSPSAQGVAIPDRTAVTVEVADLDLTSWARRHRSLPSVQAVTESWVDDDQQYVASYLGPLVRVLTGWLQHADEAFAEVYLDERLRFVPVGGDRGPALDDVARMVTDDELAILAAVPADVRDVVRNRLEELHAPLRAAGTGDRTRLVLVGDCLMTEMRASLTARSRRAGIDLDTTHVYFSVSQGVGLSTDSVNEVLTEADAQLLGMSFLTFSGIPLYTALLEDAARLGAGEVEVRVDAVVGVMRTYLDEVRQRSNLPIVLHGTCGLPMDRYRKRLPFVPPLSRARRRVVAALNEKIAELADATENVVFLDEAALVGAAGYRTASRPVFDSSVTRGAVFHTSGVGRTLAAEYADILRARHRLAGVKVICVDFDNTLWDGVMAEGPVQHHTELQELLKELKDAGILLVATSKNDPGAIRWDEMVLDPDDFVLHKIGWQPKPDSVREAAAQLDLSPASFVLLDDNPVEQAMVTETVPEVRTLDPLDPWTRRALRWLQEFPETRRTEEAARRTTMYREAAARREALDGPTDYDALLRRLDLEVTVHEPSARELDRVHELVTRTNQFNTTTRRRTLPELRALVESDDSQVLTYSLRDRFGDLGVVGVTVAEDRAGEVVLDSVVMSCRAMGFGLETLMVREAIERRGPDRDRVGLFVTSARNGPASTLFEQCGFTPVAEGEWRAASTIELPAVPGWITVHR